MIIEHLGLGCIKLTAKPLNGDVVMVADPFEATVGIKLPRSLSGDIAFASSGGKETGAVGLVGETPFVIDMPGEYEIKGVMIDARVAPTKADPKNLIMRASAEGITVGFLGRMDRALKDNELELMDGADILVIPVGGGAVMTPKVAADTIRQVEPRIVIPSNYSDKDLKEKLGTLAAFKKELGTVTTEEEGKLKVQRKDLPQDDMKMVVLKRG